MRYAAEAGDICQEGPALSKLMTTASCWTISNGSSPQGAGTIGPDAHLRDTAT